MTSRAGTLALLLVTALAFLGKPVRAQVLSPGELARVHSAIDGLTQCTKCHEKGAKLAESKCLACHEEIAVRISSQAGFHGSLAPNNRACEKCHVEHQGRDASLIDFGPGGPSGFKHAETGWPLSGGHLKVRCSVCHEERLIKDAKIQKILKEHRQKQTYLGLSTRCADCHFDEHRGQLGAECDRCHQVASWRPAPRFAHDKTSFPLSGKHGDVKCDRCHASLTDEETPRDIFPAPRSGTFAKFSNIAHADCDDCHKDPHQGKLGDNCQKCHSTKGWKVVDTNEKDAGFHEKTRFPLRGEHAHVACKSCHGPLPGLPSRFRGLPFDRCDRCHYDAHNGSLRRRLDCGACHDVNGFAPASFEVDDHERTAYPLAGAHRSVGCRACHPTIARKNVAIPESLLKAIQARKRPELFSFVRFTNGPSTKNCDGCHRDPHNGQFASRVGGCSSCHAVASFREVRFDHDRETRFALTGKHRVSACSGCHVPRKGTQIVAYAGTPSACDRCHRDVHLGQFVGAPAMKSLKPDASVCEACHDTESFKPSRFAHDDPKLTSFQLVGKHRDVSCDRCHVKTRDRGGLEAVRYRPLPERCSGCHADVHHGEMDRFLPTTTGAQGTRAEDCTLCHSPNGWRKAEFPHEQTGFPLEHAHKNALCSDCHVSGPLQPVSPACSSCHADPHAGEVGKFCDRCHDARGWKGAFGLEGHRRSNFPLTGRHATIPCEECHGEIRDRRFARAALACVACHQRDYDNARNRSIDHAAAGFDLDCTRCHTPVSFKGAYFPDHDACFTISGGPHRGIRCLQCHTTLTSIQSTGACNTKTEACSSCHEHRCDRSDRQHTTVEGYQCRDQKCYQCHTFVRR